MNNMKEIMHNWRELIKESNQPQGQVDPSAQFAQELATQIQLASKEVAQQRKTQQPQQKQPQQSQQQIPGKQLDEIDPITMGGIALATPAILSLIDKVIHLFKSDTQQQVAQQKGIIGKVGGFFKQAKKNPTIVGKIGNWIHHKYQNVLVAALTTAIPELGYATPEAKAKIADIVLMIITVKLAIMSGAEALHAWQEAHAGHAAAEGILAAVKSGEISAYIGKQIAELTA